LEIRFHDVLAFGSVLSLCTGPSGQFGPDILAFRASLVLSYWPSGPSWSLCTRPKGQFGTFVSPSFIYPNIGQNRFFITWKCRKPAMFYFWNIKNGVTQNLTSNSDSPFLIYPKTGQNRILLHGNAENRRSSIFGTSKNGVTQNLTSNSDSPSLIYPKSLQSRLFIT